MRESRHSSLIALMHLFHGSVLVPVLVFAAQLFFESANRLWPIARGETEPQFALLVVLMILTLVVIATMSAASLLAGFGLVWRARWAKTVAIIAGVVCAINIPFGTVLSVYTLWFVASARSQTFFAGGDQMSAPPPPPPPQFANA